VTFDGIYRMTPAGALTMIALFDARSGSDVSDPLVQSTDGHFYGVASYGGPSTFGTIFRLAADDSIVVLHVFDERCIPHGLVEASDGNLYGHTEQGGANGLGFLFRLSRDGTYTELHAFTQAEGYRPTGPLVQGHDGFLYGLYEEGGANGGGTLLQMTLDGEARVVHDFQALLSGGPSQPVGAIALGRHGEMYGVTNGSRHGSGRGTVFRIDPQGDLATLHVFDADGDGLDPRAGPMLGADGSLYGTTMAGGPGSAGTLWRLRKHR
jgi:uncharacterized repeat protein (TIGR03803 family)